MNNTDILEKEAIITTRYLINKKPSKKAIELYIEAHKKRSVELTGKEQSRWNKVLRFPFLLQFLDAGYALQKKPSSFRKKILLMFAILESLPEFSKDFLPQKTRTTTLSIFSIGGKTIVRSGVGKLLLWIL